MKRTKKEAKAEARKIRDEGVLFFSHSWNSGHPGVGAGSEYVFEIDGRYAVSSSEDDRLHGPYDDLDSLYKAHPNLLTVTTATEAIECIYLDAGDLAKMLSFWEPAPDPDFERLLAMLSTMNLPRRGPDFTIDGENFVFTKFGGFHRVGTELGEGVKVLH